MSSSHLYERSRKAQKEEEDEKTECCSVGGDKHPVVVRETEDNGSRSAYEYLALTEMERSGAMTQVVGSQSLLSQIIE